MSRAQHCWRAQPRPIRRTASNWRRRAFRMCETALVVSFCLAMPGQARAADASSCSGWSSVSLPGGLDAARRLLGASIERQLFLVEIARRLEANTNPALRSRLARELGQGGSDGTGDIPLPLCAAFWSREVFGGRVGAGDVVPSIVRDREALLLAHGLAALDPATLAWISGLPGVVRQIYRRDSAAFAAFGRSVRIAGGRLQVPGGAEGADRWQALVGVPVAEPARFVTALLARDQGRMAWFYDTIAHLDDDSARQALGLWVNDPGGQQRAASLARVFGLVDPTWQIARAPFKRPRLDPALFIAEIETIPGGSLRGPRWKSLWDRAFASQSLPVDPAGEIADSEEEPTDVAALAGRIFFEDEPVSRDRYDAVLFAQRVFRGAPRREAADILVAVRAFTRFPALMLTLERAGLQSPSVYASAARHADAISRITDRRRLAFVLAQFQGAVVLVERAAASGAVDAAAASDLVAALGTLRVSPRGDYADGIARWLTSELLHAIDGARTGSLSENGLPRDAESVVLDAIAGVGGPRGARPAMLVEWEGMPYRIEVNEATRRALERIRRQQGGYSLDTAIALAEGGSTLSRIRDADALARVAALIDDSSRSAIGASSPAPSAWDEASLALRSLAVELDGVRADGGALRARELAPRLSDVADEVMAGTLTALAYAAAAVHSDDRGLQTSGIVGRHDFFGALRAAPYRWRQPWAIARQDFQSDRGWRLCGSLLALDIALAEARLRRLELDRPPSPLALDPALREVLAEHVVVLEPTRLDDASRDAIVESLRRGRGRLAATAPNDLDDLARAAGLSEWRREGLRWLWMQPTPEPANVSLLELFRLGRDGETTVLSAWGPSARGLTGSLRPRAPSIRPWEELAGHPGTGVLGAELMDLTLKVAELLAAAGMPAALLPGVLASATWDVTAVARAAWPDDWTAIIREVQRLDPARVDDYLASLTGDGPLVAEPAATTGGHRE